MTNRKAMLVTTVVMGLGAFIAGCGSDDDNKSSGSGSSTATENKPVKMAALFGTNLTDYQKAQMKGLNDALGPNNGSVEEFVADFDPAKQQQQCIDAINSGRFNVIALNALDAPLGVPCARAAAAKDIPVLALFIPIGKDPEGLEPQVDGVVGGVIGTPSQNAADRVEQVKQACEGIDPCEVIAEQGTANDSFSNVPINEVAKLPNVKIVAKFVGNYDPTQVAKNLPDLLNANRGADVFLASSDDSAVAAITVLEKAGLTDKVKNLGSGAKVQGLEAVKAGTIWSDTGDSPQDQGKAIAKMAQQAVNGEDVNPHSVKVADLVKVRVITKDNVDGVPAQWGAGIG